MSKIKVAIVGYGNLGRGAQRAIYEAPDMELVGIFTRRNPEDVKAFGDAKVYFIDDIYDMKDKIDVVILCGGSATDLPEQTPRLAEYFNVIDSFDNHSNIPAHFENVDKKSLKAKKVSIISIGWDPGLFSLNRLLGEAVLPNGSCYTFWGKGVSQGHSDAIRRIEGVEDARQYTIPVPQALERVRNGENPEFNAREKHTRECFVVAKEGADLEAIEKSIKEMPAYFEPYDTTVHFITKEELLEKHSGIPHGGKVIRSGVTGDNRHLIEFSLKLDSNPEFTSSVLVAYARAAYRIEKEGNFGCKTIFDIPPAYLYPGDAKELIKRLL